MKRTIKSLKQNELLALINGLQKLNNENRDYIQAFLNKEASAPSLEIYKKRIRKALEDTMDEDWSFEIEADKCEKTLKAYFSATDDNLGYAELLVLTVELANQITLDYGDIDEEYYDQVEDWYLTAAKQLLSLNKQAIDVKPMVKRLQKVFESTDGIGWCYHDTLGDIFYEYLDKIK
ncbi:MAG TPA: hypothetical protein DET40_00285 [Lentisphaeria bacterium]|nr:MAG: hypothetical protein A2X45_10800 [Lentisphaerae bacterium GWF2_50_93]HCE41970.1 hypothetical protein [Lentisphaeria bacterium]